MSTNSVSTFTVLNFALECLRRGARVSTPLGSDTPYNLVVEANGKLFRVLVKASSVNKDGGYQLNTWKRIASVGRNGNMSSTAVRFDENDIDVIVGEFFGMWAFFRNIEGLPATVTFHPFNVEIGVKHSSARDAWAIIDLAS